MHPLFGRRCSGHWELRGAKGRPAHGTPVPAKGTDSTHINKAILQLHYLRFF